MRPLLLPHVRRLWRDGNTLQLGTDPRIATVLELDNPATVRVLDLLDGTRTERGVITEAAGFGVTAREAQAMIDALRARGLLLTSRALLPVGLTDQQRERMAREAGALALAGLAERAAAQVARTAAPDDTPGAAGDTPGIAVPDRDAPVVDTLVSGPAPGDTPAHTTHDPATSAVATPRDRPTGTPAATAGT